VQDEVGFFPTGYNPVGVPYLLGQKHLRHPNLPHVILHPARLKGFWFDPGRQDFHQHGKPSLYSLPPVAQESGGRILGPYHPTLSVISLLAIFALGDFGAQVHYRCTAARV